MNDNALCRYIATHNMQLLDAMKMIDENSRGILYVVDEEMHLLGSITDGDIRRWILSGGDLDVEIDKVAAKNTIVTHRLDCKENLQIMRSKAINSIPVLDDDECLVDIQFEPKALDGLTDSQKRTLDGIDVIIMAGGQGTRLYPYTKILPKPLIPIGDIPILERIINRFYDYGARSFYITLNYKKEMIKAYLSDLDVDYFIDSVEEDEPLGTAGSISLINKEFSDSVIVTNCDILIETDYEKAFKYHEDSGNAITVVSSSKSLSVPYGVLHTGEKGIIESIEEKPSFSYFVNTGMYILKSSVLKMIPNKTFYHMTDLLNDAMKSGQRVGMYPISESSFLDMGELGVLRDMEERLNADNNTKA